MITSIVNFYHSLILIIGAGTFFAFTEDKRRALRNQFRIPEFNLLMCSICSPIFSAFAMFLLGHKIRKFKFLIGILLGFYLNYSISGAIEYFLVLFALKNLIDIFQFLYKINLPTYRTGRYWTNFKTCLNKFKCK